MLSDELVQNFLIEKKKLKEWCDNDPAHVEDMAATDQEFRTLCSNLSWKAGGLLTAQRHSDGGLIAPVDANFISEWRDYEDRWAHVVNPAGLAEQVRTTVNFIAEASKQSAAEYGLDEPTPSDSTDLHYQEMVERVRRIAPNSTEDRVASIEKLLDMGQAYAEDEDEALEDIAHEGFSTWFDLKNDAELDVAGSISRAAIAPRILVPKTINDNVGGDLLSLYELWKDARRAFIYGAFFSSLSLSRAILEKLLRRFYKLDGEGLDLLIRNFEQKRRGSKKDTDKMHALRKAANGILHPTNDNLPLRQILKNPEGSALDALQLLQQLIEKSSLPR